MNGYARTRAFVLGEPVDRPPFMPLAIEWAAKQAGVRYRDFVYDPALRARTYLEVVRRFDFDCVLPDADFYEQLEDFGAKPDYSGQASHADPILETLEAVETLRIPEIRPGSRMGNRLDTLRRIAAEEKRNRYIFGICIGPFTEFCNARGMEDAMIDLFEEEELVAEGLQVFFENDLQFIDAQLEAGADGVQIVEPSCSLISPSLYERLVLPMHRKLVERVQRNGGFARLHICGDTNAMLPLTLGTGTHILDVDHQVRVGEAARLLGPQQALCGNLDPAGDILAGRPEEFAEKVRAIHEQSGGRIILSGGCDIPPDTSAENMRAFLAACQELRM